MQTILRKCTLLLFALLVSSAAIAQMTRFMRGGRDISSNMINDIYQDRDGIVWICTDNGLNRQDGAKNTILYSETDQNSNFSSIFEDSKGRHYACAAEHIMLLNTARNTLTPIPAYLDDGTEIKFRAYGVMERHDGTILAFTSGYGIFRLEGKKDNMRFVQYTKEIKDLYIPELKEDKYHRLWACSENGVVCWDGRKVHYAHGNLDKNMLSSIKRIAFDKNGDVWAASDVDGLWKVNHSTFVMAEVPSTRGMAINTMLTKRDGFVLLGTNGSGVYRLDLKTCQVQPFNFVIGSFDCYRTNIHSMLDDNQSNLWIGCYQKGVVITPARQSHFEYIGHSSPISNCIGSNCVQSVCCDSNLRLWIGSDNDGIYIVSNDNRTTSTHLTPSATIPKTTMTMYQDTHGRMWLGSYLQGMYVVDQKTMSSRKVDIPGTSTRCSVFSFAEDGMGRLWIATSGDGLFCMDLKTEKIVPVKTPQRGRRSAENLNTIHNRWLNHLFMGYDGILYIATTDGLCGIDVRTQNCLRAFAGKNRIMTGLNINTVCQVRDGRLFVGSSKGLSCYNTKTREIKNYTREDGIYGNTVMGIVDDGKGSLWISTNTGLTRMNLKDNTFFNYSSSSGMYSNEFSRNAANISHVMGAIFFGGTEGVCIFDPTRNVQTQYKPKVFFSGLYLDGKLVTEETLSGGKQIVSGTLLHASSIELDNKDKNFSLELSSFNFVEDESIQYEFRIDGKEWRSLPLSSNTISFTNLAPGKHVVDIRAKEWDTYSEMHSLTIIIRQPWYNTWWAWVIYLILVACIIYGVRHQIKVRRQAYLDHMQLKQQEEINEAKIQFFMNISHEIRTPMTLIMSPLQRLMQTDTDPKRHSAYQLMNRNAQRIIQLVSQLLDVRKIDKGQMEMHFREVEIVQYLRDLTNGFCDLFDTKNISVAFESQQEILKVCIDPLNFDKIVFNLLSNAFKYTKKNGSVTVRLAMTPDNTAWTLTVRDSGIGLTPDAIEHIFDRFYQSNCGANLSVQGSGVGLNLTKSLVELHQGMIEVANNEDGVGCHFTMTFPVKLEGVKIESGDIIATVHGETITEAQRNGGMTSAARESKGILPLTDDKRMVGARKRLLIVEDDEEIQAYLKAELESAFCIDIAPNGEQAINLIRKQKPDIIISDVMMPVMDGIQLLHHIRTNTIINNIPVILLTAKTSEHDNIEALEHGADAYITKPFNIEIVRRTAMNLVQRQQQLKNIYDGRQTPKVKEVKMMSPDERLMERILKVVNENISNPALGNEVICEAVGISRVHLYRKLKEMTNLSLRDFIKNIRLTEAARLLSEKHHSIAEVAEKVGFENVSYFTVVFKQKYGMSPSAYMKSNSNSKEVAEIIEK